MDEPQRKYTSLFSICFHQLVGRLIERFSEAPDRVGESGDSNSRDILLEEILHQLRLLVYAIYRGFYTSLNGAGFLPSTVCPTILPILPRVLDKIFPEMFGIPLGFWISTWSSWFSTICPMANLQKTPGFIAQRGTCKSSDGRYVGGHQGSSEGATSPDTSTNQMVGKHSQDSVLLGKNTASHGNGRISPIYFSCKDDLPTSWTFLQVLCRDSCFFKPRGGS